MNTYFSKMKKIFLKDSESSTFNNLDSSKDYYFSLTGMAMEGLQFVVNFVETVYNIFNPVKLSLNIIDICTSYSSFRYSQKLYNYNKVSSDDTSGIKFYSIFSPKVHANLFFSEKGTLSFDGKCAEKLNEAESIFGANFNYVSRKKYVLLGLKCLSHSLNLAYNFNDFKKHKEGLFLTSAFYFASPLIMYRNVSRIEKYFNDFSIENNISSVQKIINSSKAVI